VNALPGTLVRFPVERRTELLLPPCETSTLPRTEPRTDLFGGCAHAGCRTPAVIGALCAAAGPAPAESWSACCGLCCWANTTTDGHHPADDTDDAKETLWLPPLWS
jgi:hypothetical protein